MLRGRAAVPAVSTPCNPLGNPTVTSAPFIPQRAAGRDGPFRFCGTDRSCHYRGHKLPRASHRRVRRTVNRLHANPRSSPNGIGAEGRCGTSPFQRSLCERRCSPFDPTEPWHCTPLTTATSTWVLKSHSALTAGGLGPRQIGMCVWPAWRRCPPTRAEPRA